MESVSYVTRTFDPALWSEFVTNAITDPIKEDV